MKHLPGLFILMILAVNAPAATWYVDGTAAGSHNGTSWANAWTGLSQVSGVKAGDTVYISGGASGSSQTYSVSSWKPAGGASGNPITYQIGQDAAHNGTAIFSGSGTWFGGASYAIISGNAGDGAMHFSLSGYSAGVNNNSTTGLRISYVNLGSSLGDGVDGQGVTAFEFDHNYCYILGTQDHFLSCGFNDSTFDGTRIHDNTIFVPKEANSANGADAFQIAGSGWSLYNNNIQGYNMAWSGAVVQHQDGIQTLIGSDIKIYGNVFADLANTSVFMDGYYGAFNHIYIYNNVCQTTSSADNNGPGGIEVGADGAPAVAPSFNDVIVANNDMIDQNPYNGTCIAFGNCPTCNGGNSTPYTACYMINNIAINSGTMTTYNSPISTADNVTLSTAQGLVYFTLYIPLSANNNYHLTAVATLLIGNGINESAYFTTDKDGNSRPATGNWDVGAYQFALVTNTTPVLQATPGSIVYGTVLGGTSVTNSFTVKNAGGGTLSGTASVGAPFSVVSGGSYSLGAGQTQAVTVVFSPTVASNYNQTVSCSGGSGTNVTVTGNATNTLVLVPSITNSPAGSASGIITEKMTANITNLVTLQFTTNLSAPNWQTLGTFTGSTNLSFTNLPAVFIRGVCSNLTGSVTLTWPPSGAPLVKGYMVYYGQVSHNYTSSVDVGKATTATISNLAGNKVYYFAIDSYGLLGNVSPYLSEISATPQVNLISFSLTFGGS